MKQELINKLFSIDPSILSYDDWLKIGMAIHSEGGTLDLWNDWSKQDSARFDEEVNQAKWASFKNGSITGATISYIADYHGNNIDTIVPFKKEYLKIHELTKQKDYQFKGDTCTEMLIDQLTALFSPTDYIDIGVGTYLTHGREVPSHAKPYKFEELIKSLKTLEIAEIFGNSLNKGAFFRVNPTDGKGSADENITKYKYTLIECDSLPINEQYTLLINSKMPIVTLTSSGGKSLHAITRVDAKNEKEYRERVYFLHEYLKGLGYEADKACKNPSRLTRLAGFKRGDKEQYLHATHLGCKTFKAFKKFIEEETTQNAEEEFEIGGQGIDFIKIQPTKKGKPLIKNALDEGAHMLLTGGSKTGKTWALLNYSLAQASGKRWLNFEMVPAKVWHFDFELGEAYLHERVNLLIDKYYKDEDFEERLNFFSLRENFEDFDTLSKRIVKMVNNLPPKDKPSVIVLDPLYIINRGDENKAQDVHNMLDKLKKFANACGNITLVIAHHHSKGDKGNTEAIDRSSGSGVFARWADMIVDLLQVKPMKAHMQALEEFYIFKYYKDLLTEHIGGDIRGVDTTPLQELKQNTFKSLKKAKADVDLDFDKAEEKIKEEIKESKYLKAEVVLRNYPAPSPFGLIFKGQGHEIDVSNIVKNMKTYAEFSPQEKGLYKIQDEDFKENKKNENDLLIMEAFENLEEVYMGEVSTTLLADTLGVSPRTVRRKIKEHPKLEIVGKTNHSKIRRKTTITIENDNPVFELE